MHNILLSVKRHGLCGICQWGLCGSDGFWIRCFPEPTSCSLELLFQFSTFPLTSVQTVFHSSTPKGKGDKSISIKSGLAWIFWLLFTPPVTDVKLAVFLLKKHISLMLGQRGYKGANVSERIDSCTSQASGGGILFWKNKIQKTKERKISNKLLFFVARYQLIHGPVSVWSLRIENPHSRGYLTSTNQCYYYPLGGILEKMTTSSKESNKRCEWGGGIG